MKERKGRDVIKWDCNNYDFLIPLSLVLFGHYSAEIAINGKCPDTMIIIEVHNMVLSIMAVVPMPGSYCRCARVHFLKIVL